MTPYPHLDQAPIQEALIDIRATLAEDLDTEALREAGSPEPGFPIVQEARKVEARVELREPAVRSDVVARGMIFRSDDERRIAQFRSDGFTFNWLRPYHTWEDLYGQARTFWQHYERIAQPQDITRIAVRYINRFPISLPIELNEVFSVPLELPPGLVGVMRDFLYRTTFNDTEREQLCSITLTGEPRAPDGADLIFDIDCFEERNFPAADPVVWDMVLPKLRGFKNQVFFSGLTESMIERFR